MSLLRRGDFGNRQPFRDVRRSLHTCIGSAAMRVLLMGEGDLAEEVDEALEAGGADVRFLVDPDDESVRAALDGAPGRRLRGRAARRVPRPDGAARAPLRRRRPADRDDLRPGDGPPDRRVDPALHRHLGGRHRRPDPRRAVSGPGPRVDPARRRQARRARRRAGGGLARRSARRAACAATPRPSSPPTTAARRCSSTGRSACS